MEGKTALDYAKEKERLDNIDFLEGIKKARVCLSGIPYEQIIRHLSSQNILTELIDRSGISYEELKNKLEEKENLELLLSLGGGSEILKARSIDDNTKLKEIYRYLVDYTQDTVTKRQLQAVFIRKRTLLTGRERTEDLHGYERE